ncbi:MULTISPECIES: NAD(P)-dependent alcohol dehydrogenase [Microbacterium]|jgi:NADPH:quinone reductase-like Zn-dependent oxidoreductase|uniref:NAD(P)-dependent alcohol dehydrogenase n=1 Tax=Microbacterium TaxID=33882 RepID=UPI001D17701A|nr:NAD(P)-dependent alcohol dehydrogenase [Microbacterium testaceum]MCC4249578.1 NAD(P)-dependent alcohol dehydrogenase [Microbacterium testaceum]
MDMNAAVVHRYGPPEVVRIERRPRPRPTGADVVVEVAATSVTSGDARIRAARFPAGFAVPGRIALGLRGPRRAVLGIALSGRVVETGPKATGLRPGDRVCGMTDMRMGAHAQYAAVPRDRLVGIPDEVDDDRAAAVLFGGTAALWFLRDRARVRPGESVLVVGGSGAVGSHAVQIARALGAEVTATARAENTDLLTRLGAHHAIDRSATPLTDLGERYDVVFDTAGVLHSADASALLSPSGRLLLAAATLGETVTARGRVIAGTAGAGRDLVSDLVDRVAEGTLTPVIDATLPLDRIAEAHARVDSGHKVGTVLVHP